MKQIKVKVGALSYAQLILYMLEGIHNCQELADLTGLHYVTVLQYTRELYKAKACHICSWEKDSRGREMVRIYKIGKGKDAKKELVSNAERQARYRSKKAHINMMQRMASVTSFPTLDQCT